MRFPPNGHAGCLPRAAISALRLPVWLAAMHASVAFALRRAAMISAALAATLTAHAVRSGA